MDFFPSILQTKSLSFSAKLKMEKKIKYNLNVYLKKECIICWNVNETNVRMHSDVKILLTWPSLLQDLRKQEIAF